MKKKLKKFEDSLLKNFLLLLIVPLIIFTTLVLSNEALSTYKNVFIENKNISISIKETINTNLNNLKTIMDIISENKSVQSKNFIEAAPLLQQITNKNEMVDLISIMEPSTAGEQSEAYKTSGSINNIPKGDYYELSMKGETVFTEGIFSSDLNKKVIIVSKPFYHVNFLGVRSKSPVGVIVLYLNLDYFKKLTSNKNLGENGSIFIVDKAGKAIIHPNNDMKNLSTIKPVTLLQTKKEGTILYEFNSKKYIATFVKDELTGWGIVTQQELFEAYAELFKILKLFIILMLIFIGIGSYFAKSISKKAVEPLNELKEKMNLVEKGNLNINLSVDLLNRRDEFGSLANGFISMIRSIEEMMKAIEENTVLFKNTSNNLFSIGKTNSRAMEEIYNRAELMLKSSEENSELIDISSNAIEEISKGSMVINENTMTLKEIIEKNSIIAEEGFDVMKVTSEIVNSTYDSFKEIRNSMDSLENSATNIGGIVVDIKSISEQTNLLALNAAIEAARAGESGRGFAVVADEIRKLSSRSNESAEKITHIVQKIQSQIENIISIFTTNTKEFDDVILNTNIAKNQVLNISTDSKEALESVKINFEMVKTELDYTTGLSKMIVEISSAINEMKNMSENISYQLNNQAENNRKIEVLTKDFNLMSDKMRNTMSNFSLNSQVSED